ncbi:MAG: pirin family protein [Janthinobacterium lividum]
MNEVRKAEDRGHAHHGWLNSHHTFSFADYRDPQQMGWSSLRVINDDTVEPDRGFGTHSHRDMEIISYVLEGALQHKDSMGTGSIIKPGAIQLMSAGTGVTHSEFNPSRTDKAHFLQIWIIPKFAGVAPSYQEKVFETAQKRGRLRLVISPDGQDASLTIQQDARIYASLLDGDEAISHALDTGRHAYVHVARGELSVNGQTLHAGDGLKIADETAVDFTAGKDAEFLFFDLP